MDGIQNSTINILPLGCAAVGGGDVDCPKVCKNKEYLGPRNRRAIAVGPKENWNVN